MSSGGESGDDSGAGLGLEALRKAVSNAPTNQNAEQKYKNKVTSRAAQSERAFVHLEGLRSHYRHKEWWSYFLMLLMFIMIVFQCALLAKVGQNKWDFSKYKWLLPALLVQNLAQVIGLAVFVVKALFKDLGDR